MWPWCYECVTWLRCFQEKICDKEANREDGRKTNRQKKKTTTEVWSMKESAGNCLVLLWRSLVLVRMPPRIKTTSRCVQLKCPPLRPSHGLCMGPSTTPLVELCFTASCLSGMCQGFSFRGNRMQSFRTLVLHFFPLSSKLGHMWHVWYRQWWTWLLVSSLFYCIFFLSVWEMYGTSGLCSFLVIVVRWNYFVINDLHLFLFFQW